MRRAFFLVAVAFVVVHAGSFDAAGQLNNPGVVHAFLSEAKQSKPTTVFSPEAPGISLVWKCEGFQVGDKIRVVWIAEDVGAASPKWTKINEGSAVVYKSNEEGTIWLARPRDRTWPLGKYRAEIYIGKQIVQSLRFTVQSGATVEIN
jgi:hypothetical protein